MLKVCGLTVRYGAVAAVSDVDLTIGDGEVLALLGPSGCGKSTLLRAVAGLEPADGTVSWDGTDLADVPVHRRGFGLVFQDGQLFPHRDVAGNVAFGLRMRGEKSPERVAELLSLVGLAGYESRRVASLSGGEQQRVALARALAPRPRLLLLDEPLSALDRSLREQLAMDLATLLRAAGTTALVVTHDHDEAFTLADRVAVMNAGRISQVGHPAEVWQHPVDEITARFLGCTTFIPGTVAGGLLTCEFGTIPHPLPDGQVQVALRPAALRATTPTPDHPAPASDSHAAAADGSARIADEFPTAPAGAEGSSRGAGASGPLDDEGGPVGGEGGPVGGEGGPVGGEGGRAGRAGGPAGRPGGGEGAGFGGSREKGGAPSPLDGWGLGTAPATPGGADEAAQGVRGRVVGRVHRHDHVRLVVDVGRHVDAVAEVAGVPVVGEEVELVLDAAGVAVVGSAVAAEHSGEG